MVENLQHTPSSSIFLFSIVLWTPRTFASLVFKMFHEGWIASWRYASLMTLRGCPLCGQRSIVTGWMETTEDPSLWADLSDTSLLLRAGLDQPVLGQHFTLCKAAVEVCKGCDSCMTPRNHGWVRCACGNGIKEQNKLQPDTLLVVVNLVNIGLSKFYSILSGNVAIL